LVSAFLNISRFSAQCMEDFMTTLVLLCIGDN